jgi:uncharacterized membrane protein
MPQPTRSDIVDTRESQLRSIIKAVTYRSTGTVTTAAITWGVTGEWQTALAVGSIEPLVKLLIYYVHERLGQRVRIGTIRRLVGIDGPGTG